MHRAYLVLAGVLVFMSSQHGASLASLQPWPRAGVVVLYATTREALDLWGPVWYYEYGFEGPSIPGHQRVYLVRPHFQDEHLERALHARPGSWWLVGNEPNDPNQDSLTPATYAAFYQRFLARAGLADASCRVVPAGIANADWRWADAFREAFRAQYGRYPRVDAWNIHNYILEEGADQYDVAEFQRRIVAFRAWMSRVGERHKPLLLTEYGVLYGSGCCDRPVEEPARGLEFMRLTTQWLWQTDYVQAWSWFSLASQRQFNGDLLDASGKPSEFGSAYRDLAQPHAATLGRTQ